MWTQGPSINDFQDRRCKIKGAQDKIIDLKGTKECLTFKVFKSPPLAYIH